MSGSRVHLHTHDVKDSSEVLRACGGGTVEEIDHLGRYGEDVER